MQEVDSLLEEKFNSVRFEHTSEIKHPEPRHPENYIVVNRASERQDKNKDKYMFRCTEG
jgi:hypothetical protein